MKQIIHIVDMDGTYIKNACVKSDESLEVGQTVYDRDNITNIDSNNIIRRNRNSLRV